MASEKEGRQRLTNMENNKLILHQGDSGLLDLHYHEVINQGKVACNAVSEEGSDIEKFIPAEEDDGEEELVCGKTNEKPSLELLYNPFSNDSNSECCSGSENMFSDNIPICECGTVKKIQANPDTQFLISLLPDMDEMNLKQKSVFKERALKLLDNTLSNVG